jgi:HEAT repeat protein
MMKIAFMVVTASLFTSAVAKTPEKIHAPDHAKRSPIVAATTTRSADLAFVSMPQWAPKDSVDSLYQAAHAALSKGDYSRAADLFERIYKQFPNWPHASETLYYAAFANYRVGGSEHLQAALESLTLLNDRYQVFAKTGDARALRTRVCGELARLGDEGCAAEVSSAADASAYAVTSAVAAASAAGAAISASAANIAEAAAAVGNARIGANRGATQPGCPADNEDDERVAALNALMQMDAERAMPILAKVLERRDACSAVLRRKAIFLVSQKRTPETANVLLRVARNDPDEEVREQAVFWLSQVPGDEAVSMLQEILNSSNNDNLKNKALFALSQHRSERGTQILRDYAARDNTPDELRSQAIFWLGQRRSPENSTFLRNLYSRVKNDEVKDKILFSLSQQRDVGNDQFLLDIAANRNENLDLRKKALFWAGQGEASVDKLLKLYSSLPDAEMREQLVFVYSQRRDPAMVDKLLDIARNDRDPELRKKAIFWLGQSHDPRVQQFLMDLINK